MSGHTKWSDIRRDSAAEAALAQEITWLKLPEPVRELMFASPRKWRFDFAWPEHMVAVEVEGGVYVSGRHTRGAAFEKDCEKYAEAGLAGWLVLRVTPRHITEGAAIDWLTRALKSKESA